MVRLVLTSSRSEERSAKSAFHPRVRSTQVLTKDFTLNFFHPRLEVWGVLQHCHMFWSISLDPTAQWHSYKVKQKTVLPLSQRWLGLYLAIHCLPCGWCPPLKRGGNRVCLDSWQPWGSCPAPQSQVGIPPTQVSGLYHQPWWVAESWRWCGGLDSATRSYTSPYRVEGGTAKRIWQISWVTCLSLYETEKLQ